MSENGKKHRYNTEGLMPPWKPGQSGNPAGRPKGTALTDRLRAIVDGDIDGKNVADALIRSGVSAAMRGDFRFWQEILNRLDGKVPDRIAGPDGRAIQVDDGTAELRRIMADPEAYEHAMQIHRRLNTPEAPGIGANGSLNGHKLLSKLLSKAEQVAEQG